MKLWRVAVGGAIAWRQYWFPRMNRSRGRPQRTTEPTKYSPPPWCWIADLLAKLSVRGLRADLATIACSVNGGYTPMKLKWSQLVRKIGVACNRGFKLAGLHEQFVARVYSCGMIERIGRGTYALPGREEKPRQRLIEACKRVPQGVICLFSALWFHGLIPEEPEAVWITIDKKSREPQADSFPIKFVLSSRDALSRGVVTWD